MLVGRSWELGKEEAGNETERERLEINLQYLF